MGAALQRPNQPPSPCGNAADPGVWGGLFLHFHSKHLK